MDGLGNGAMGGGGNSDATLYYDDGLYFAGYADSDSSSGGGLSGSDSGFGAGGNEGILGNGNGDSSEISSGSID